MRPQARLLLMLCASLAFWPGSVPPGAARAEARASSPDAPSFVLPALSGTVASDSLRGHVVLVDFWASWCSPCAKSFPWLDSIQDRYRDQGLRVVAINLDKQRSLAERFLRQHPASFTVAFDPEGRTAEAFGVEHMPSSFLIAADGSLLYEHAGFQEANAVDVESRIREAVTP